MKLLVFADSTRLHSFNPQLATCAAAMARAGGAEVTQLDWTSRCTTPTCKRTARRPGF